MLVGGGDECIFSQSCEDVDDGCRGESKSGVKVSLEKEGQHMRPGIATEYLTTVGEMRFFGER